MIPSRFKRAPAKVGIDALAGEQAAAGQIEILQYWMERWAGVAQNNQAAAAKECGANWSTFEGENARTNYSTAEDDSNTVWEVHTAAKLKDLDAAIDSLRLKQPWTYWAFCVHFGITYSSCWRYPHMDPEEGYRNALEELRLVVQARGLVL